MEYPHCDSSICNLFCYRKKVFIQSVSNGDHDGISLSGMRAYKSDVYGAARGLCRGMENSILCVPNGKVFSGRCSDELLLWKRGIPGVGDN